MKKLALLMALSVTSLVCAAQDVPTVPVPAVEKQIELPTAARKMWPDEFAPYLRAYDLSNGQALVVYNRGSTVYAALDHDHPHKLMALSGNTFVSQDRALKMHVELGEGEAASGYVLIALPAQQMADGSTEPAQTLLVSIG